MQLTTKDLWILENSYEFMEDLPKGKVRCVEFMNDDGMSEDFYYRNEKNAKNKFNELAKKHDLKVKGNWWKNDWGKNLWMGTIVFED